MGPPGAPGGDSVFASGTRLTLIFLESADGLRVARVDRFFDALLQVDCAVATASDGRQRCMPVPDAPLVAGFTTAIANVPQVGVYYDDPACSHQVALAAYAGPAPRFLYTQTTAGPSFFEAGGPPTFPVFTGSMGRFGIVCDVATGAFVLAGAAIPPSSFVEVTRR
jgi:hypothetical protein